MEKLAQNISFVT